MLSTCDASSACQDLYYYWRNCNWTRPRCGSVNSRKYPRLFVCSDVIVNKNRHYLLTGTVRDILRKSTTAYYNCQASHQHSVRLRASTCNFWSLGCDGCIRSINRQPLDWVVRNTPLFDVWQTSSWQQVHLAALNTKILTLTFQQVDPLLFGATIKTLKCVDNWFHQKRLKSVEYNSDSRYGHVSLSTDGCCGQSFEGTTRQKEWRHHSRHRVMTLIISSQVDDVELSSFLDVYPLSLKNPLNPSHSSFSLPKGEGKWVLPG